MKRFIFLAFLMSLSVAQLKTTTEVLNEVYTGTSLSGFGTTNEVLSNPSPTSESGLSADINAVLDDANDRLQIGIQGGTITDTTTFDSTVTMNDSLYVAGQVQLDSTLTVNDRIDIITGSAGAVTADGGADELTIEGSGHAGISLLSPDGSRSQVYFGSPSDNIGALLRWKYDDNAFTLGTNKAGASIILTSGNGATALTLDASQNATFAGDLSIPATKKLYLDATNDYIRSDGAGLYMGIDGGEYYRFHSNYMHGGSSNKFAIFPEVVSSVNPVFVPARGDGDTGLGWAGADQLSLIAGGVEGIRITEDTTAEIQFPSYGSGSITGTVTQRLGVDSSGNVIEIPIGGGAVDGSGTTNYITKWTDSDALGNSILYDNGTNVGVKTISPVTTFDVNGGVAMNITTVNAATYNVLDTDYTLNVTYSVTGACAITIPTALNDNGRIIIIKDGGFLAGTNNITVDNQDAAVKVDGDTAGIVINGNAHSVTLQCDGTDWFVVSAYRP